MILGEKYITYEKEFYALEHCLEHWQYYLLAKQFVLWSDHDALKFINDQRKLREKHAKWVYFLQDYSFVLKDGSGVENIVDVALSRVGFLLHRPTTSVAGFENLKDQYTACPNFAQTYNAVLHVNRRDFVYYMIADGCLFHGSKSCIPKTLLHEFLI